jgi:hypothetical protein
MAKFIISLVRHIEWPNQMKDGNFKIGIYGSFDLYKAITDETINIGLQNRNTDILNLSKLEDIKMTTYHIIIVSEDRYSEENLQKINGYINLKPTLLITDKEGATKAGSGINFIIRNNKLAYELNKSNACHNGIKIGKQVETYADRVEE